MAPPDLKKMLQVNIKPRQDSYTDQFSRIFMVKMMMLTSAVTAISWMKDKLNCIVPKSHDINGAFVAKACWINGLYVYREIHPKDQSFYYGIPTDISMNGYNKYGDLCKSNGASCQEMERTFFLQYQWFPIGVAALAFLYYLPYLLFRLANADMQSLKGLIAGKTVQDVDFEKVIQNYFSRHSRSTSNQTIRVLLNILVKILYVVANIAGFIVIDSAINKEFIKYGGRWSSWLGKTNEGRHDYTQPDEPKPGHHLLPGFGLCELTSVAADNLQAVVNVHTYVCELTQHILYQYILIVMWYIFILGIVISIVGFLKYFFDLFMASSTSDVEGEDLKVLFRNLTSREKEYMKFVRRKSMPIFGELLQKLKEYNSGGSSVPSTSNRSSYGPPEKESMQ
ncbi:uncharacterized protein LOC130644282 [Hydractinia symbiolongicarpus]|uniref:uncharacterized protein LOC130644282 n=1 Tax=Hydractinia symbiolongicarpus TaxID=13093 RepID=UPI00254A42A9|nr:uncharacterized protein LOC130644282 [Hydractinia symbiolongicarpus]